MPYDVFISHSTKDKLTADAVVNALESNNVRCFITPRDIPAGESWPATISKAITDTPIMVLIFSKNSNSSGEVDKEIALALKSSSTIIPFRIDNTLPKSSIMKKLADAHWLDALNPLTEDQIKKLLETVGRLLPERVEKKAIPPQGNISPQKIKKKKKLAAIILPAMVLFIAAATLVVVFLPDKIKYDDALALFNAGNYSEAYDSFAELEDYKDSASYITECKYQQAVSMYIQENFDSAYEAFTELAAYKDSADYIHEIDYQSALLLFGEGNYSEAKSALEEMKGYKDSDDYIIECEYQECLGSYGLQSLRRSHFGL